MKRLLLNLLTALSLLLCVVTCVVGACSYLAFAPFGQAWFTQWMYSPPEYNGGIVSDCSHRGWLAEGGSLHVFREDRTARPAPGTSPNRKRSDGIINPVRLEPTRLGFAKVHRAVTYGDPLRGSTRRVTDAKSQWSVPLWLPALLLAALPAWRLVTRVRRVKRRRQGSCPSCGYDLRATPDRCPECGYAPPGAKA
jgi:hypothetical protein